MKNYFSMLILLVLSASLLAACASPTPQAPVPAVPTPQDGAQGPLPPAGQAAVDWIAVAAGLPAAEVLIVDLEERTWTDSCLGLGGPAESCLLVMTPGFRIQAAAAGRLYTLHTNMDGSAIRQDPGGHEPVQAEEAGKVAVTFAAAHTGLPVSAFTVQQVEPVEWPDACLGVPIPNAMCAQVLTPGYRITLAQGSQTLVIHSDLPASNMAVAPQP
jgi:hypothetical protein